MKNWYCKKSWSTKHSFEEQKWIAVNEDIKCRYCGLVLDDISIEKFVKQKKEMEEERIKYHKKLFKSILK